MSRPPLPANQVAYRPTRAKPKPAFKGGRPKCPKYLAGEARAEWQRIVRLLAARGTLTCADAPSLELYVLTYSSWRKCQEEIQREGPITESTVLDSRGEPHTVAETIRGEQACRETCLTDAATAKGNGHHPGLAREGDACERRFQGQGTAAARHRWLDAGRV